MQAMTRSNQWGYVPAFQGNLPAERLGPELQSLYQTHLDAFDHHQVDGPNPAHLTR